MKLSAILAPLIAAKVPHEVILATVKAYEDQQESTVDASKEKARARWHKWKANKDANVSKRLQTTANGSRGGDARGVDNLLTKNSTGQKENKKEAAPAALSDLAAFKADLVQDATAEQVDAFAKHRKAKKGQNSAYAAKLVRRDAQACSLSVSELIDMAISRGWLTVKPEYLAGRQQSSPRAASPPAETVASFSRKQLFEQRQTDATDNSSGRVVQIDARRLENSPSGTRTFAVSGNLLGRI